MATGFLIGGVSALVINGTPYTCNKKIDYNTQTIKYEGVPTWPMTGAIKSEPMFAHITFELITDGSFLTTDFNGMAGASIVALLANGKTVSFNDAFVTEIGDVSAADGTFSLTFNSVVAQEY